MGRQTRAGKLRLIFWKRCLSHRQAVESPVLDPSLAPAQVLEGGTSTAIHILVLSRPSVGITPISVKIQLDRIRSEQLRAKRSELRAKGFGLNIAVRFSSAAKKL